MDLDSAHTEPGFGADMVNEIQTLGISDEATFNVTCFSHTFNDILIHFQVIRLPKQAQAEKKLVQKLISLGYTKRSASIHRKRIKEKKG